MDKALRAQLPAWMRDRLVAERRRKQGAVNGFVAALAARDLEALAESIEPIEEAGVWVAAFRKAARIKVVQQRVKEAMLRLMVGNGDHIRSEVGDDAVLIPALRTLLPSYEGPPLTLYRGDSAWNRRHRSYGASWTTDEAVADGFARGVWRTFQGGSVVLQTQADCSAIVCVISEDEDRFGEAEVLLDRRRLKSVTVLRRYEQQLMETVQRTMADTLMADGGA